MRSLSADLTSKQKSGNYSPLSKIALTAPASGGTSATYEQDVNTEIVHLETPLSSRATVTITNFDNAITTDYKGYQGVISYGMTTDSGAEYSAAAPMVVVDQEQHSSQGVVTLKLTLVGRMDRIGMDRASQSFAPELTDTRTVKDLVQAIIEATLTPFTHTVAYTATFDSEDSLFDSVTPADAFFVGLNESRLEAIRKLLGAFTKTVMRMEDDGEFHFLQPTVSGGSYDYEYRVDVSTYHELLAKVNRKRLLIPNRIIVESNPDSDDNFSGEAEDTDSSDITDMEIKEFRQMRLASDAEAANIAAALLEKAQTAAEKGSARVQMNVGQEVFDWILLTDSRASDTVAANVMAIRRVVRPGTYEMTIAMGDINLGGFLGLMPPIVGPAFVEPQVGAFGEPLDVFGFLGGEGVTALIENAEAVQVQAGDIITNMQRRIDALEQRLNAGLLAAEIDNLNVRKRLRIPLGADKWDVSKGFEVFDDSTPAGNRVDAYGTRWRSQTFTPTESHILESVKVRVARFGSPGTVTVSIRATSGSEPTGSDLGSGTFDGDAISDIPPNTNSTFQSVTISPPVLLAAGTEYAIVIRALGGDSNNRVDWQFDNSGDSAYPDGDLLLSTNSGASWSSPDPGDAYFQEVGYRLAFLWVEGDYLHHIDASGVERVETNRSEESADFGEVLSWLGM